MQIRGIFMPVWHKNAQYLLYTNTGLKESKLNSLSTKQQNQIDLRQKLLQQQSNKISQ